MAQTQAALADSEARAAAAEAAVAEASAFVVASITESCVQAAVHRGAPRVPGGEAGTGRAPTRTDSTGPVEEMAVAGNTAFLRRWETSDAEQPAEEAKPLVQPAEKPPASTYVYSNSKLERIVF